jgi:hypothetical protein
MLPDNTIAAAANCSPTWLHNASRLLHHPILRTQEDSRWWRLVRVIHSDLGLTLRAAAKIADATLRPGLSTGKIRLNVTADGALAIQLDLERFLTSASAALSTALNFSVAPRRGRPPRAPRQAPNGTETIPAAAEMPIGRLRPFEAAGARVKFTSPAQTRESSAIARRTPTLAYDATPNNLERLATALRSLDARPRDIPDDWPHTIDAITIRSVPKLALHTSDGPLNLIPG